MLLLKYGYANNGKEVNPRQRQTRREAGTQSYGLLTVLRGGRIRLPGYRRDGRDPEYAWWTGLPYDGSPVFFVKSDIRSPKSETIH
jgi:hypothetical protein